MPKKILTIGVNLASDDIGHEIFSSKASLLDWDIVLFKPDISSFINMGYDDHYQGKPSLNDHQSFKLREACEHWRREINEAVEGGKTVFVFLSEPVDVFIATGEKQYSGTGRNQKVTRIVTQYSNFSSFPCPKGRVATNGREMNVCNNYAGVFQDYWNEFSKHSSYHVVFPFDTEEPCITTKNGEKPVSVTVKSKKSNGHLVLLPDIDFEDDSFFSEGENGLYFNKEGVKFSNRFVASIISLDRGLRLVGEVTPTPNWAEGDKYTLIAEREIRKKLLQAEMVVEKAQLEKEEIYNDLLQAGSLTPLLFEKGKPLESAILDALKILGFSAEQYKDSESEFDVVFTCEAGRLLGEAEGKDNKAINIEKLRQLSSNIHEDLLRDEVDRPAKGILFGNGYRLVEPEKRPMQFTTKCVSSAESTSIGLLSTCDLYLMAKHQSDYPSAEFTRKCQQLLIEGIGILNIPELSEYKEPETEQSESIIEK